MTTYKEAIESMKHKKIVRIVSIAYDEPEIVYEADNSEYEKISRYDVYNYIKEAEYAIHDVERFLEDDKIFKLDLLELKRNIDMMTKVIVKHSNEEDYKNDLLKELRDFYRNVFNYRNELNDWNKNKELIDKNQELYDKVMNTFYN